MRLHEFFENVYRREKTLSPESKRQLEMSLRLFSEMIGDRTIHDISHNDVNQWMEENPRCWLPKKMKRRVYDVLAVWQYAYDIGMTSNEPKRRRIRRCRVPRRIPQAWTLENLQAMMAACGRFTMYMPNGIRRGDVLFATICIGYYTALRAADLWRLKREQLSPGGAAVGQGKKYGTEVLAIVPQWVIDFIDERYPREVEMAIGWPYSREHFYAVWREMLTVAGLPCGKHHGLQRLRRTAVSYGELVRLGFGAQLAGHTPGSKVTYENYADPRIVRDADVELPDLRPAAAPAEHESGNGSANIGVFRGAEKELATPPTFFPNEVTARSPQSDANKTARKQSPSSA